MATKVLKRTATDEAAYVVTKALEKTKNYQSGDYSDLAERVEEEPLLASPSEPRKKNQYLVSIEGLDVEPYLYQYIKKPSIKEHGWTEMEIHMINTVESNLTEKINKLLKRKKGFLAGKDWSLMVTIDELDSTGKVVETTLYSTWIREVDFGELSYGNDELSKISMRLKVLDVQN